MPNAAPNVSEVLKTITDLTERCQSQDTKLTLIALAYAIADVLLDDKSPLELT